VDDRIIISILVLILYYSWQDFGTLDPFYYGDAHCLSFILGCVPSKLSFEEV
jgi:hypothetical protein